MAEILKRAKPLAVNPLKASQPVGASLAFLGLRNAMPMLHGSQGCTVVPASGAQPQGILKRQFTMRWPRVTTQKPCRSSHRCDRH
jgi:hypothetical protein